MATTLSQRDIAAITTYFTQAESDAGMRSMHGAFVAMAMSGVMGSGGTKDHEAWVTDFRFGRNRGLADSSRIGRSRIAWNALRKVSEQPNGGQHITVLFAAYGGIDWSGILTRAFDSVTAARVLSSAGPVGVALLTKTLRDAYAREQRGNVEHPIGSTLCEGRAQTIRHTATLDADGEETVETTITPKLPRVVLAVFETKDAPKRGSIAKEDARRRSRAAWNNEGGYLVRLVKAKDLPALQGIKDEARAMLRAASVAFSEAMPVAVAESRKPKKRRTPEPDTFASEVLS